MSGGWWWDSLTNRGKKDYTYRREEAEKIAGVFEADEKPVHEMSSKERKSYFRSADLRSRAKRTVKKI